MNFARLNHILIPGTKTGRDRLREKWILRILLAPIASTYLALSHEGRALLLFSIVAGFAGLDVARSQSHVLWALLFSLLVGSLALRRLFDMPDVRIRVEGPERVMVGEEARFRITLENRGDREHDTIRVEGPFLPWDGSWGRQERSLPQLGGRDRRALDWRARFVARGQHHIDAFSAAALVPLRLALGPRVESSGTRFKVVPRIAHVRELKLPVSPRYQPGGVALASRTGEAMELVGVRPYRPGDPIRDLHARSWARTGEPVVKEYHQEYFSRVGVVLDTSPEQGELWLESGISLAAGIVARLSRGEALIDLLVTGDELHPLTLGRSLGYFEQALDHLACVEAGPAFESARLVNLLRPHLHRLSSVIFVSLGWDSERSALAQEIASFGVGCGSFAICSEREALPLPPETRAVDLDAIRAACDDGLELAL